MAKLLELLGVAPDERRFANIDAAGAAGRIEAPQRLRLGAPLPAPSPIFPRYLEPAQ